MRFKYKDSKTGKFECKYFDQVDFLKRLAQHVLPRAFHRVREFGFLAPAAKKKLFLMQSLLGVKIPQEEPPELPPLRCRKCQGIMLPVNHERALELRLQARDLRSRPPPQVLQLKS